MSDILKSILESDIINTAMILILAYLAFLWIAIILWVTKDIIHRTSNMLHQILAISSVIFLTPLFGLLIYLIIRPTRTLIEQEYEEIITELCEKVEHTRKKSTIITKKQQPSIKKPAITKEEKK